MYHKLVFKSDERELCKKTPSNAQIQPETTVALDCFLKSFKSTRQTFEK